MKLLTIQCESKKTRHPTRADNFAKYEAIFTILSLIDSVQNLLQNDLTYPSTL